MILPTRKFLPKTHFLFASIALFGISAFAADSVNVTILKESIRLNGVEICAGPKSRAGHFISLEAAEKTLGSPQDTYMAGLGVTVYAWPNVGIEVQRGFRGPEEGKIFKFQVWLHDFLDVRNGKHSGAFSGAVHVGGVKIAGETTIGAVRQALESAGFKITESPSLLIAKKGNISIFTVEGTKDIERVEVWCD